MIDSETPILTFPHRRGRDIGVPPALWIPASAGMTWFAKVLSIGK